MSTPRFRLLVVCCSLLLLSAAAQAKTHPFGWEDMFAMVRLSDPQPSADGKWVLYSRKSYDVAANSSRTTLALVSADGKIERALPSRKGKDGNGRWLPDGRRILFLSDGQIWERSVVGGTERRVTSLPIDIDGFEVSPDGKRILFWSGVFVDAPDLAATARRLKERSQSKVKATIFNRLLIRHWDTWNDGRRNHLFVMSLTDKKPRDLMAGMDQDAPTKPHGGSDEVTWSPDSKWVAFTSKPSAGEAWTTNGDVYLAYLGGPRAKDLTINNKAWDGSPVFSPDGNTLAWLSMDRAGYESDKQHIMLWDRRGNVKPLAADWDRSVSQIVWEPHGRCLYAVAAENAREKIFRVSLSGKVTPVVETGHNTSLTCARDGRLFFLHDTMRGPAEVFSCDPASGRIAQVSHVNDARVQQMRTSKPEEFWFDHDGFKIHGWLLRPVDFKEGRKYPLAFLVHGGPQGNWTDDFHYRWNPQFYAGAGYAVLAIDFRGSSSYGQAFQDAIRGNWGPGPYSDLMAGLDYALAHYPFIDTTRMAALGASFGGYMVNWIEGQDNPFKCLVSHDGDFDTMSSYYDTEELWFPEWEMGGPPWEKREVYERNSPSQFVSRWKTPMLLIHGGNDFRVVETEGFSTFNALQRRGVPSKLLYFPDETHWVTKPQNSRLWHRTVLAWIDHWTHTRR